MTASWILFLFLSIATGNPLVALLLLAAVLWTADRVTLGLLPEPARAVMRWRRGLRLRAALATNPNDRRARLELADLLLARRPAEAAELVRRNVEAGDEDVHTAFVLGAALARAGEHDRAERAFSVARELDPAFRMGEIDLELGRARLARRDAAGAREALERLVAARPGTVEGRWLLSRALAALGDEACASRVRNEAWREFTALPRFRRRHERRFAWRLRPLRGAAALAGVVALVAAGAVAVAGAAIVLLPLPAAQSCAVRTGNEVLALDGRRVHVTWVERLGRIALLGVTPEARPDEPAPQADVEEAARVLRQPRDPRRAWAHVHDGARLAVFPISMAPGDLDPVRAHRFASYAELVAYLRGFEERAGAIPAAVR